MRDQLSRLVYSTDQGRIEEPKPEETVPETDGIVRIRRETKGRKGKGVTIIEGLGLPEKALKPIAKALKTRCSVGGSVKDFTIEIQGDQREACMQYLQQQGYKVKLSGG
ncbi:stress response translation initiation inhibitor YciH [Aliidiomarina shirensis]|uniref:Stress response translation initiation inhibitor YciH n=1 Tax=Aliidiomarina shirensis TaxID=1048642 RepID=A0A432WWG4_9GAMM|nr:stress response translation initiation inhibitor YciH [Aliidiomarina shirensis]RUO38089.1 stress response translation initiation inhibitor YciH [Aliidiomarina shirensis]